ncbi:MAG: hypothetical protein ACE5JA_05675 [bacterium]
MGIVRYMNERVKRFTIWDVKLAQGIGVFAALIIAKLIPRIMDINLWWFVVLLVLCAIRPLYALCFER